MKKMNSEKILLICFLTVFSLLAVPISAQQVLTLEECRKMALEQNKKIRMAKEDAQMACLAKKAAATKYLTCPLQI